MVIVIRIEDRLKFDIKTILNVKTTHQKIPVFHILVIAELKSYKRNMDIIFFMYI